MKTALVFGASGQIGTPLLRRLSAAGWQVLAVSRDVHADAPGRHWLRGDLCNVEGLPDAVDAIFSCGPLDQFARWHAEVLIRAPRVLAFGSTSASSKHDSGDAGERDLSLCLLDAEDLLFSTAEIHGAAVTILRPTLIYGAGRDQTLTRIAGMARRWGRFVLPRRAHGLRQPVHVDDLADAAWAACQSSASHGRSYDLPGGETLAYRVMVQRVLACLQPAPRLLELPMPLFRGVLAAAQLRGIAVDFTPEALARMRQDLVFDSEPARRDFAYSPRMFKPDASMFGITRD
ncbi:NAD-dependent epimerase/dehydratase family protein [Thermomonas sp.]|uniref:SDR family oxidoreductase n=1 Tax=Thermomonas sp. TaxID=1971895 RepID=UPI00248A8014|nr:NAD-dependent epimerase/dehydratase family protein [Thermomonas sp.]MDI1254153.1 NAD-dependent epimerase/dehydratase family protein [Thermomonas sp.]